MLHRFFRYISTNNGNAKTPVGITQRSAIQGRKDAEQQEAEQKDGLVATQPAEKGEQLTEPGGHRKTNSERYETKVSAMKNTPPSSDNNHLSGDGCNWFLTELDRELEQRATEIATRRDQRQQAQVRLTGEARPVPNRTPKPRAPWVAHSSVVSPTEQVGVMAFYDTEPAAGHPRTSPTSSSSTAHRFVTANNHSRELLGTPTVIETDHIIGPPLRWVPWSPAIAFPAVGVTWLVATAPDTPGGLAVVVMACVSVCSALLMTAHALAIRATRPGRRRR